jgi:hypothetical protein
MKNPKHEALESKKVEKKEHIKKNEYFGGQYDAKRNNKDLKKSISHRIKHF